MSSPLDRDGEAGTAGIVVRPPAVHRGDPNLAEVGADRQPGEIQGVRRGECLIRYRAFGAPELQPTSKSVVADGGRGGNVRLDRDLGAVDLDREHGWELRRAGRYDRVLRIE